MTNNIFEQYPYWLDSTAWYELIRAKNKNDEDKIIRLSSPIIIENKFIDPTTGVEKLTITDGKNIERIETSDILTTQKLPRLVMFGFSINEKYIKSLGNALQLMRQSLPISTLYTGVGVLSTDEGTVISLDELYLSKDIEQSQADEIICETKYDLQPKYTAEDAKNMTDDEFLAAYKEGMTEDQAAAVYEATEGSEDYVDFLRGQVEARANGQGGNY